MAIATVIRTRGRVITKKRGAERPPTGRPARERNPERQVNEVPKTENVAEPASGGPATLGERVAFFREQANLTQSGLARAAGISQPAISLIERNDRSPTAETVKILADALGVTVGALFGDPVEELSDTEALLFRDLRGLPQDLQDDMHDYARFLRERKKGRGD